MIETIADLKAELENDLEAIERVKRMLSRKANLSQVPVHQPPSMPVDLEKLLVAEADFNQRVLSRGQYYSRRLKWASVLSMAESHETFEVEASEEEVPKLKNILFASRYRWSVDLRDGNVATVKRIEWASA